MSDLVILIGPEVIVASARIDQFISGRFILGFSIRHSSFPRAP